MRASGAWSAKKGRGAWQRVLLTGVLSTAAIVGLSVTLTALLISNGKIGIEGCGIAKLFYAAAVLAGCFLTAKRAERGKLLWAGLTAVLSCLLVLGICFAQPEAPAEGLGRMLAVTVLAWLAGAFLGTKRKRNGYL